MVSSAGTGPLGKVEGSADGWKKRGKGISDREEKPSEGFEKKNNLKDQNQIPKQQMCLQTTVYVIMRWKENFMLPHQE